MSRPNVATRHASAGIGWPAAPGLPELAQGDAVHLVGIGGAGMRGLATVMADRGLKVSGSDREGGPALAALGARGIVVHVGHDAAHVGSRCRMVIASPAIPSSNPEIKAARAAGIPVTKRAVLLGSLLDRGRGVAVAGTHGKTTTTAWLAVALLHAGLDPTVFVGGDVAALGGHARLGMPGPDGGEGLILLEADEYDRSFLNGHPQVAVVTNLEHDHPDIYPELQDVETAFGQFVANVRSDGRLILWAGMAAAGRLAARCAAAVESYAVEGDTLAVDAPSPRWIARDVHSTPSHTHFDIHRDGVCLGGFSVQHHGRHNIANALAVIAAGSAVGVEPQALRDGLAVHRGVSRRMDVLGEIGGVGIVDDYAHHPTEIAATIDAARTRWPRRRLWVVLQPHTYSRVAGMATGFAAALEPADEVVLAPVFGAREKATDFPDVSSDTIGRLLGRCRMAEDLGDAASIVADEGRSGDVAIFLGAGDITRASRACLRQLARVTAERLPLAADAAGLGGMLLSDQALARFTSLRVGGMADLTVRVDTIDDLVGWAKLARDNGLPFRIIGRGTNVLIADEGLRGLVLINRCETWQVEPEGTDEALLIAEGGVTLAALAQALARQGWAGIEAAVGIPGSVAGSVVTNAGAHGWDMAASLRRAEVLTAGGERVWMPVEKLELAYRSSRFKGSSDDLILRAELSLQRDRPEAILARIAEYTAHRRRTQPSIPSVGSMFRNPPGDYAGRLIEACGLKGLRVGGAQISEKHANFFVNQDGARAEDVRTLIDRARSEVAQRFDVQLHLEIEPLGPGTHGEEPDA